MPLASFSRASAADVVSWQLPTWLESLALVAALSRLGAIQNPMLPIYRAREVGFITKQAGSRLLIVPGTWRNFDYEEMAREIAGGQPGLEILVANKALPQGELSQQVVGANFPAGVDGQQFSSLDPQNAHRR